MLWDLDSPGYTWAQKEGMIGEGGSRTEQAPDLKSTVGSTQNLPGLS